MDKQQKLTHLEMPDTDELDKELGRIALQLEFEKWKEWKRAMEDIRYEAELMEQSYKMSKRHKTRYMRHAVKESMPSIEILYLNAVQEFEETGNTSVARRALRLEKKSRVIFKYYGQNNNIHE